MAYKNYIEQTLRASAATSGAAEQDAQITIPESVSELWVLVTKTAEANADNLLTVRLQSLVNSIWFDLAWDSIATTQTVTVAADLTADVIRKNNIVDVDTTTPTYSVLAHFKSVPTRDIRIVSVSSGTAVANTFAVTAYFMLNQF